MLPQSTVGDPIITHLGNVGNWYIYLSGQACWGLNLPDSSKERATEWCIQVIAVLAVLFHKIFADDEPPFFLVGENEKIFSAHSAVKRLNNLAPQIRTEIVPNAGHDLIFVQTEMVNRKVLEFLKGS